MRSIVCPFCFNKMKSGEWQFRCKNPDPNACPREPDKKLQTFRGPSQTVIDNKVFDSNAGSSWFNPPRDASCPVCGMETHRLVCPHCHNALPNDLCHLPTYIFGLIGTRESGKSQYVGTIINSLENRGLASRLNGSLAALGDETRTRYINEFRNPLFVDKRVVDPTTTARVDYTHKTPLLFCLVMDRKRGFRTTRKAISLTFYDTAGEDLLLESLIDTEVRYLANSNGLILMIDPLQIESVRSQISDTSILPVETANPYDLVNRVSNVIREHLGLHREQAIEIPIALAFSKCDALDSILHKGSALRRQGNHDQSFDIDDFEQVNAEMEALLEDWLGDGFNQLVRKNFKHFAYLGFSALGRPPGTGGQLSGPVNPHRVEDPLLWLLWKNGLIKGRKGAS